MNRAICVLSCVLLATFSGPASAQQTRTALPGGNITGLEMTIEGPQQVRPGETARWLIAAHEIHRDRDFRPAAGIAIRMFASLQRDEPVAEATTDAQGRSVLSMDVPEDADGFELLIDARSTQRLIRRRFRVYVQAEDQPSLGTAVVLARLRAGESNAVYGELRDVRNLGLQGELRLFARAQEDGRVLVGPMHAQSAPDGSYAIPFTLPEAYIGNARIEVSHVESGVSATTHVQTTPAPIRRMQVRAAPSRQVARPGESIPVTVYVRDSAGRPLQGAVITGLPRHPHQEEAPRAQTDARGHATIPWFIQSTRQRFEDRTARLHVVAPGVGERDAQVSIRVSRAGVHAEVVPEGGALIPGVPTELYVRYVTTDGRPRANQRVSIAAPRIGTHTATTNADGVAHVEVTLAEEGNAVPDECGGATALAVNSSLVFDDDENMAGPTSQTLCAPVDPDGMVRVRAHIEQEGLQVQLSPRTPVRNTPMLVTLVRQDRGRLLPIDQRVLPAGEHNAAWPTVPEGELLVRVRPLIGPGLHEVRGGMAWVRTTRSQPELRWQDNSLQTPTTTIVAAVPPAVAHSLMFAFERFPASTDAYWNTLVAMRTPRDEAAPAILRDGQILPLPATAEPVSVGVLRDPWRQRARYRTGRLALVIRALESFVASSDIADVAVQERGRWRFNRALLDAIADDAEIGPEGARDLGGLPLGIEALEAMDASLTFDRMARRITRERLLRAFVLLRQQVRQRNLDLAFGRRGTPADWITAFAVDENEALFRDAWSRAIRLTQSARASEFDVVPGWKLTSAGPDGRFGNGDDLSDFTARVVPSGSLYADAMDEDGLLARLNGVALGRATLQTLADLFDVEARAIDTSVEGVSGFDLPRPMAAPIDPSRLKARGTDVRVVQQHSGSIEPELPSYPANYTLIAMGWHGAHRVARIQPYRHGHGVMLAADWPERLGRTAWQLQPQIVAFDALDNVRVVASARGARVDVDAAAITLRAGESQAVPITILGGTGREASVDLRIESNGTALWTHRMRLPVHDATVDRTQWAGAWVGRAWNPDFDLPDDARNGRGELVVVAHDRLFQDPLVRRWDSTALRGWAAALVGQLPDETMRASLDVRGDLPEPVEAACALLAWTALSDEEGVRWHAGYRRALGRVTRGELGDTRQSAATLAALAPVAGGAPVVTDHSALQQRIDSMRNALWNAMRTHAEQPELMARASAALLLADEGDASGRALFVAARRAVVDHERGGRWIPGEGVEDGLAATAALAIAANIVGEHELRDDLRRALGTRAWLGLLREGDSAFWLIAASSYGALGSGEAQARVDGTALELDEGVGRHRFTTDDDVDFDVRGQGLGLARVRVRYDRPISAQQEGPLELSLEGDVGTANSTSALEILVAADADSPHPELLVQLPPGALLDRASRIRVGRTDIVKRVHAPDREGMVRIQLEPMNAGASARVPLPVRWSGAGETRGLAIVGYDTSEPWATYAIEARDLDLR